MASIDKIKLGVITKSAHFDKSHDVNTTCDFGFCQPTLVDGNILPDSKISLKSNMFLRLSPLVKPSFARVQLRSFTRFVPMSEVFEAFKYMMAEQAVSSAFGTYVPDKADYIYAHTLFVYLFIRPMYYEISDLPWVADTVKQMAFVNVWHSDHDKWISVSDSNHAYDMINQALNFSEINFDMSADQIRQFKSNLGYFKTFAAESTESGDVAVNKYEYMRPLTIDNADFILKTTSGEGGPARVITFHLTKEGKRLYKIINALGINFAYNKAIPVHLFFAYYKAWFDTFNPGRDTQWRETPCYKLIHQYYDRNIPLESGLGEIVQPQKPYGGYLRSWFFEFIQSLPDCCYSLDIDPLTVCMQNPWVNNRTSVINQPISLEDDNLLITNNSSYPEGTPGNELNGLLVKSLLMLYKWSNKESVIGKKVGQYLSVKYGMNLNEVTNRVGSSKINVDISDVTALAETEGSNLGDYAGKGVGSGTTDTMKYTSPGDYGILVQFACVVPFGGYSQADGLHLNVNKNDFYQPQFDSLGYEAVPMSAIFGSSPVPSFADDETFGYRPRFFNYKYMNNVRNGDFHRRGAMSEVMPYQLDRFFTEKDIVLVQPDPEKRGINEGELLEVDGVKHQANEALRFIGLDEAYGNYNRLFYITDGRDDNFILHIVHDYHVYQKALPIDESFDTFNEDGVYKDNSVISAQHA